MATSTLIQYLDTTAEDEFGNVVSVDKASHRRQIETFLSGGAITAGDIVAFDTAASGPDRAVTVVQAGLVATGNPLAVGVALDSAAGAGEKVTVVVAGYAEDVNCTAGTIGAAGLPLSAGKTAAGEVDASAASDTAGCFGVSLEAKASNTVDMIVFKRF